MPLVAVSAPWSLGISLIFDVLSSNPFHGPSGEAWAYGTTLMGILLNCVLVWLFVKLTVGRVPRTEKGTVRERPRD